MATRGEVEVAGDSDHSGSCVLLGADDLERPVGDQRRSGDHRRASGNAA